MSATSISPDLDTVLKQALSLPKDDQVRLAEVMSLLCRNDATPHVVAPADDAAIDAVESPDLPVWLDSIKGVDPWSRLRLIEDALTRVEPGDDADLLHKERELLVDSNPPLAIRASVTQLVEAHPWACLIGSAGLCLGLFGAVRWFFNLVF